MPAGACVGVRGWGRRHVCRHEEMWISFELYMGLEILILFFNLLRRINVQRRGQRRDSLLSGPHYSFKLSTVGVVTSGAKAREEAALVGFLAEKKLIILGIPFPTDAAAFAARPSGFFPPLPFFLAA